MIQQLIVDVVVAAAAAWLVWSFAPSGLRRRMAALAPRGGRARALAASPLAAGGVEALQAQELDGRAAPTGDGCGPGCGCA
jgi:hypothetical protein